MGRLPMEGLLGYLGYGDEASSSEAAEVFELIFEGVQGETRLGLKVALRAWEVTKKGGDIETAIVVVAMPRDPADGSQGPVEATGQVRPVGRGRCCPRREVNPIPHF